MNTGVGKECEVCNEEFNEEERCPRSLPCSHCICSDCIDKLIATGAKLCPYCRQAFQATSARDIGANIFLLEVLKMVREMELNAVPPQSPSVSSRSKLVAELKEQTAEASRQIIVNFREAKEKTSGVHQFNNTMRNSLVQCNEIIQNEILVKIHDILRKNTLIVQFLDEQNRRLDMQMTRMNEKENQMEEGIKHLHAAETLTQTAAIIDEIDGFNLDSENWLQNHEGLISENVNTRQTFDKVIDRTRDRLRILKDVLEPVEGEVEEEGLIPDLQLMIFQEDVPLELTVEHLRRKPEPVLELIRQGKVYAFQELEGRRRFAKMSVDDNRRICLHQLTEQALPSDIHLLQHSDILKLMNASSRLVFLELSSEEKKETLGTLYIRLSPNTKKAEQFSLLCSAEKGPSFVKSNILKVHCKGTNYEAIWCGDYENLGGKGGKALVSDVWNESRDTLLRPQLAGTVWGRHPEGGETLASQFWICTRDNPEYERYWCFGMVEEGLPILQEAINCHIDVRNVVFSDAGLVLPI